MALEYYRREYTLSSNLGILSALTMVTVISINIIETISFLIWTVRARIHLRYNEFMAYNNSKQVRTKNMFKAIFVVIILLILLLSQPLNNQDFKFPSASFIIVAVIVFVPRVIFILMRNFISKKKYLKDANLALYALSFVLSIYLLMGFTGVLVLRNITQTEDSTALAGKVPLILEDFGKSPNTYVNEYVKTDKSILASRINY